MRFLDHLSRTVRGRSLIVSGPATLNVRNALAPVAFANLRFSPRTEIEASCPSGFEIIFDGKVTGSISLAATTRG